ncbi:MAG: helix-turn-helix domain-containing protein [Fimbriiglobus sp.]
MLDTRGPVLTAESINFRPSSTIKYLPAPCDSGTGLATFVDQRIRAGTRKLHSEWLAWEEPELIRLVLDHFAGNLSRAADVLGINRATLRKRMKLYGIRANEPDMC